MLSVLENVPVDNKTHVVTSSVLIICRLISLSEVFIGVAG
jgi:hypothetical protein